MNLVGETVWNASTKVRNCVVADPLHQEFAQPAVCPPKSPQPGILARSKRQLEGDLVGDHFQRAGRGETAAVLARSAGVGHQPVLQGAEGVTPLEDLDRGVAAVGVAGDLAVVAVFAHRAAGAVPVEVVVGVVGAGLRVDAAEEEVAGGAAAGRGGRARGPPG